MKRKLSAKKIERVIEDAIFKINDDLAKRGQSIWTTGSLEPGYRGVTLTLNNEYPINEKGVPD